MRWLARAGVAGLVLGALILGLWLARGSLVELAAESYFRGQGVPSSVRIKRLGRDGARGEIALGPASAPDFYSPNVELDFNPSQTVPEVVAIRAHDAVIRATMDTDGAIHFPSLQAWIDRITAPGPRSRFVSPDLVIALDRARVVLATPYGPLLIFDGAAEVRAGELLTASGAVSPATLMISGARLQLSAGNLRLVRATSDYALTATLSGSLASDRMRLTHFSADVRGNGVPLSAQGKPLAANSLHIRFRADSFHVPGLLMEDASGSLALTAPVWIGSRRTLVAPTATLELAAARLVSGDGELAESRWHLKVANSRFATLSRLAASGDFAVTASGSMSRDAALRLIAQHPVIASDARLTNALVTAASALSLSARGHAAIGNDVYDLHLAAPALLSGSNGARLRVAYLAFGGGAATGHGAGSATLNGPGFPSIALASPRFGWDAAGFSADASLRAERFSFGPLHDANVAADGRAAMRGKVFILSLARCGVLRAASVQITETVAARGFATALCPAGRSALYSRRGERWTIHGAFEGLAFALPSQALAVAQGSGTLGIEGTSDLPLGAEIALTHGLLSDATGARFRPLSLRGTTVLGDRRLQGRLALATRTGAPLGTVAFTHDLATASGNAQIDVASLQFHSNGLQPGDISPLAASLHRAEGRVAFQGAIAWRGARTTSSGRLSLSNFTLMTPGGLAHGINANIALRSLLPLQTEPHQHVNIAALDAFVPITGIEADFALEPATLVLDAAAARAAGGGVTLAPTVIALTTPLAVKSIATLSGTDLTQLIAATNLGDRVKLTGRVSGTVPFSLLGEDIRIADGHIAADGPGRLEIDRTLWTKGAPSANAVEDFAYQALEHLAFDTFTADLNSIANGRLSMVFHIVGKNDPPTPKEAHINLFDLLNGTAFQKPIDLPSGTGINLTLDSTLNFDELLRSYSAIRAESRAAH